LHHIHPVMLCPDQNNHALALLIFYFLIFLFLSHIVCLNRFEFLSYLHAVQYIHHHLTSYLADNTHRTTIYV